MKVYALTLGLLGALSAALAASWAEFPAAFPSFPCQDGWSACLVDGQAVNPDMVRDSAGRPHPADMRLGFFDLQPLPSFSPFVTLSPYTGQAPAVAAAEPPPAEPTEQPEQPDKAGLEADPGLDPVAFEPPERDPGEDARPVPAPVPEPIADTTARTPPPAPTPIAPTPAPTTAQPTAANPATAARTAPSATPTPVPTPATNPATAARTTPAGTQGDAVASATPTSRPATASAGPKTCDDLVALEAASMMGTLGADLRKCLEGRMASTTTQTTRNKISRVLIQDAAARGDKAEWEQLMKRHLQDIDRSDPDMCLSYAIHLSRGGAGRAQGVIKWADYALENKQQWEGATYKKKVYSLYKLRAEAANKLWQEAEKKFVEDRSDENEAASNRYRDMTKNYAREWLDYARASAQSTKEPLGLCVSAAGSTQFCEG